MIRSASTILGMVIVLVRIIGRVGARNVGLRSQDPFQRINGHLFEGSKITSSCYGSYRGMNPIRNMIEQVLETILCRLDLAH